MTQIEADTIRAHLQIRFDQPMPQVSHAEFPGLAQRALAAGIRSYQVLLSPVFGNQCRFYPTCSHYALQAIAQHGAGKGTMLSLARIARCNPFCEGGHDPVPDSSSLRS